MAPRNTRLPYTALALSTAFSVFIIALGWASVEEDGSKDSFQTSLHFPEQKTTDPSP